MGRQASKWIEMSGLCAMNPIPYVGQTAGARPPRIGRAHAAGTTAAAGRIYPEIAHVMTVGYYSQVKEAQISELKNQLSRYLALVRKGEIVRIVDRNRPVAHLVPISHAVAGRPIGTEALAEMERKGLIRRGTDRVAAEILDSDPPGQPAGVLAALLEEREVR
jgi:prevent-host-death family protein